MQMIEPEEGVQTGSSRLSALLPVHPPEIDTLVFQGVMKNLEVGLSESRMSNIKSDRFAFCRVLPKFCCHGLISFFMGMNTLGRMEVERGF